MLSVGGLIRLSALDYPDHLAAVVFCQGCPWRCGYCHNPHLVVSRSTASANLSWSEVMAFLSTRRGLLDAVVFSGGEPTAQRNLGSAMREVKALGFKIGLHTAGVYPSRLAQVLPLLDWVGMDVKASFARYHTITGVYGSGDRARRSAELIVATGVACEFRTTVHRSLLSTQDLMALAFDLETVGARRLALQEFRTEGCMSAQLAAVSGPHIEPALVRELASRFEHLVVRTSAPEHALI